MGIERSEPGARVMFNYTTIEGGCRGYTFCIAFHDAFGD